MKQAQIRPCRGSAKNVVKSDSRFAFRLSLDVSATSSYNAPSLSPSYRCTLAATSVADSALPKVDTR